MTEIGQFMKSSEAQRFVTGSGCFVDDLTFPNMAHAVILRSIHAHAVLKSVDTSAATAHTRVITVLTGQDIEGVLAPIPPPVMGSGRPVDVLYTPTPPLLATGRVRYVGEPIAVVVAESLAAAQDAVDDIQIEYEPLLPLINPLEAAQNGAPIIHPTLGTNVVLQTRQQGGDVEGAFAQADHIVRQDYDVPRLAPLPLETRGVAATYDPQAERLTVWNSTQAPQRVRANLAELLNRPTSAIRVIAPDVGGSFGIKDCLFPEDVLMPYLALQLQRPVKWIESRRENLLSYHGRGQHFSIEAAVRHDGVLLGIRADIVADQGAYMLRTTPFPGFNACRRLTGPYHIPAVQIDLRGVVTNQPPTGAYRGTGGPESAFCMERTLDLIAQDLKLDPAEVRRRNFIPQDADSYRTVTGVTYDPGQYAQTLERALEQIDYARWRDQATRRARDEPLIGIGLATCLKSSGASGDHRQEHARVVIDPSGSVVVYTGISPHGQGSEMTFAQLSAEILGIDLVQIRIVHSDTELVPFGEGTSASRGLIVGGSAVYLALQAARQKLARIAAHHLSCTDQDVEFDNSCVFNRHQPETAIAFSQLTASAYETSQLPSGMEAGLDVHESYTLPENPFTFGAHAVVVEVSRETGDITILRYVAIHDCGHILNAAFVEGQVRGGIAQGIGQALTEGIAYTPEGQPMTGSLMDYAIPRASTMPELSLGTLSTFSPTNPLGAKGIGSVSTVPAPAAITNAVMDALSQVGVRHLDMPLTPAKIWQALEDSFEV